LNAMTIKAHKPSPLGFLVTDIARLMRRRFDQRISEYGFTQTQWRAILVLSANPGASQKAIAELLEIQPISLARLMDRMEAGGWVERHPDPNDRRAVKLFLTAKAAPILGIASECSKDVMATATKGMSKSQRQELLSLLVIVKDNLSDL